MKRLRAFLPRAFVLLALLICLLLPSLSLADPNGGGTQSGGGGGQLQTGPTVVVLCATLPIFGLVCWKSSQ
jgi:hypothetical protein